MNKLRNNYVHLSSPGEPEREPENIDIFMPKTYRWGKDFYISVFRHIEEDTYLSGFTFYMATHVPYSLPAYGKNIILVLTLAEDFAHSEYFHKIHCIIRCLGTRALYLDGLPSSKQRAIAFVHYIYKQLELMKLRLHAFRKFRMLRLSEIRRKTLHVPIGLFSSFDPIPKPIAERKIDYAFLGSVSYTGFKKRLYWLIMPPKIFGRHLMLKALQRVPRRFVGKVYTTGDFFESIDNDHDYEMTMGDTKISICPRGTTYETYRFSESCKAGCVVICESLPNVWFYKDHPGFAIKDWSGLPATIEMLLSNKKVLEAKSAEALNYWESTLSERAVASRISEFVSGIQ